jgi:hypothetical protein
LVKSLLKLEFLKNERGVVGEIRLILFLYSLFFFYKITKLSDLADLNDNYVWTLGILLVAQIGEKGWKQVSEWLKIWKGE